VRRERIYINDTDRRKFQLFDKVIRRKAGEIAAQEIPTPQGLAGSDLVVLEKCVTDPERPILPYQLKEK